MKTEDELRREKESTDAGMEMFAKVYRKSHPTVPATEGAVGEYQSQSAIRETGMMSNRPVTPQAAPEPFQSRVMKWTLACFGEEISNDHTERNHRFLEEALELVQSRGCSRSESHQLVDYVFDREQGDSFQECGGVMVTLAALCNANSINMEAAAEREIKRVWGKIDKIRAKQAAKPKHSPLPAAPEPPAEVQDIARKHFPEEYAADDKWKSVDINFTEREKCVAAIIAATKSRDERIRELERKLGRERTQVAELVTSIKKAVNGRQWLTEGRGPFEWNDDDWMKEFKAASVEILDSLGPFKKIAADWSDCPTNPEQIKLARMDWKDRAEAAEAKADALAETLRRVRETLESATYLDISGDYSCHCIGCEAARAALASLGPKNQKLKEGQ